MENQPAQGNDFWNTPEGQKKAEEQEAEELNIEEMGGMSIKIPKPLFDNPTVCTIEEVKFFKVDTEVPDKNGTKYKGFFITVSFVDPKGIKFNESYRGGRIYTKEDGKQSIYIGAQSQLGRLKAVCLDNGLQIGQNVQSWATILKGRKVSMKRDVVMFQGKKFDKNFVLAFVQ